MAQFSGKVYRPDADTLVVASGGLLDIQSGGEVRRTVQRFHNAGMRAGSGAGFTTAGNTGAALCPASQSGATLVVPISGLKVGDTIAAGKVIAQIESAGNTVTLDCDFRKLTNAAADPADASLGAITQVSVTADTAVAAEKTFATPEVVASGEQYYALITVTTTGSTDVQVLGVETTVQEG
jgi:hypothetical protein